ncbi:MAG: peroxide stress protein YaaA [Candidatus Sedimenticola sp. (ex Thyasira tokunagai)]
MLIVISPAKTLDYETPAQTGSFTQPDYLKSSGQLIEQLRRLSAIDIAEMMKVSMKIAELNFDRLEAWRRPFTLKNSKQALLAFKGDVYTGLNAIDFSEDDLAFAQDHLRILSGLYGLLRPLDLMQPYRLEMGRKLKTAQGGTLYQFWGEILTKGLNKVLAEQESQVLINLASNEYFKAVKPALLEGRLINPVFKERKGMEYKIIGVHAKKARGLMSRFIIKNRLQQPEALKAFVDADYCYNADLSNERDWVFTRG